MSNQSITAIDDNERTPAEQVYQSRYYASGVKTVGTDDSLYAGIKPIMDTINELRAASKTGTVSMFLIFSRLEAAFGSYSNESLAGVVQAQNYAQAITSGFSDVNSALVAIQKLAASNVDNGTGIDYENAAQDLLDAISQLAVDLYGEGYTISTSKGDYTFEGTTTWGNGEGILAESADYFPLNPDGTNPDGNPSAAFLNFQNITDQMNTQFDAFNSMDLMNTLASAGSNGDGETALEALTGWCEQQGELSLDPDNDSYELYMLINGTLNTSSGVAPGIESFTQDAMAEYQTDLTSDIKKDQSLLESLTKTMSETVNDATKAQDQWVQAQKGG